MTATMRVQMTVPPTQIVRVLMWRRVVSDSMMFDWIMFLFRICDGIMLYNFVRHGIMLMMSHWIVLMVSDGIVLYGVFVIGRWGLVI